MNKLESVRKEIAFLRKAKLNNEIMEYQKIKKCPCCYTKLTIDNTVNMLNCNHALCKKCHIKWFDDECNNTCPMCRTENYKSIELSKGLKVILNQRVSQLDSIENEIHMSEKYLRNINNQLSLKEKKMSKLQKRIKQLKLEKTNHKYSNIASKLNWKNNPKLGVDYWQKQLNKKNKGIEKRTRNFHHIMLNEFKDLAYQFNHKNEYIKPNEMLRIMDTIQWMDDIMENKEEENDIDIEFTEYELNELFHEDESEYSNRLPTAFVREEDAIEENSEYVSNRIFIGESTEEEDSDMDIDTDTSMPELEEVPQDYLGYRDEDIFDESSIRTITPPPIQRNSTLPPPINRQATVVDPNLVVERILNYDYSTNSVRRRIMTAVMGLTDEEINTFTLQE